MGTHIGGILGNFRGKVGAVIGSKWKGVWVMRGRPDVRKGKPNPALQQQQAKFALMVKFLQPLSLLLNETHDSSPLAMTAFNNAVSENLRNAMTGVYPALAIDYSKVVLSKGIVQNPVNVVVTSTVVGKLAFTWPDNSGGKTFATDTAFIAVYNADLNRWIYVEQAAPRNAGTYTLDVTAFSGKAVQTYIGFVTADGKNVSNSLFTGAVNIL